MKCYLLIVTLIISVKAAPFIIKQEPWKQTNQLDQSTLNQIAQQSLEQWVLQNQYYSMQQMMAMQHLHAKKPQHIEVSSHRPVPSLYNVPQQPLLLLIPSTIAKTTNRIENHNENNEPDLKFGIVDADSVVINAENEDNIRETSKTPQRAVVVLPNGQRLIIGSIISAIPFLPFEVNVPDTIGWIYNGIAGIIGGIGQRLPFRPKPTTESPVQQNQESMAPDQESVMALETGMIPTQEASMLMQKLMSRRPNVGMLILMLPVTQTVPIQ
ncbi:uncharacterized protein LOC125226527 [Leguminivora glycinivorella]|uniref:uncharacterized protein LOC125226527 n=1 Tax=Leguminivora glycinivorella TaxID=1035111 RepID=UPI00200D0472|nr:uncharacterized protein LOC125226527 [Leguminivora glycinivorella]